MGKRRRHSKKLRITGINSAERKKKQPRKDGLFQGKKGKQQKKNLDS